MIPPRSGRVPGDLLLHPVVLAATALYAFNDWWLKASHPGWLSGKLSDVAGMVVLPATMVAVVEVARQRVLGRRAAAVAAVITVVGFTLVEIWAPAESAWCWTWGALQWPFRAGAAAVTGATIPPVRPVVAWSDPTDLITLPFAALVLIPRGGPPARRRPPRRDKTRPFGRGVVVADRAGQRNRSIALWNSSRCTRSVT